MNIKYVFLFILSKIYSMRKIKDKNNHLNIVQSQWLWFITIFLWITNSQCIHLYILKWTINTCILFLNQKQLMKTWQWTLEIFYPQDPFLSYFRNQNLLSTMPIKGKDYIDLFCNLNLMWLHKIKWNRKVKKSKYESSTVFQLLSY